MTVSVIVPWRPDGGHRDRAWSWVAEKWRAKHPDWQAVTGTCRDGPWIKARAVWNALNSAGGDILVVADADVWCADVALAVEAVERGAPWAVPHGLVYRLAESATADVVAGHEPTTSLNRMERLPYRGVEGGGIVVLPRATYEQVPLDPRFEGWGQEDECWALALRTLAGSCWRGVAPLWHLYHDPQPRLNRHVGSAASRALQVRYQYASRDPKAMRALVAEIGGADAAEHKRP